MNSQYDKNVTSGLKLQLIEDKSLVARYIHFDKFVTSTFYAFSKLRIYYRKIYLKVFRILTKS